jgi:1,4-alpha-glucan branching enzyme
MIRGMNQFYLSHNPLWERDFDWTGYEWIDFSDAEKCVISYLRKGSQGTLACVHNFTPEYTPSYFIRLKGVRSAKEVFNSDSARFGGSDKLNTEIKIAKGEGFHIALAPLATMIFEVEFA